MNILIVDDSRAMRLIVRKALRQAGYGHHELDEASNGREALGVISSKRPDLILCDWNMPEMSGIELLAALASHAPRPHFGFVTSEGSEEMRDRAAGAGAEFLITKPFTAESFSTALRPIIGPPVF